MSVDQILALRPFVPAKDFSLSKRFYRALGFELTFEDEVVAFLKMEGFSFILRDFAGGEIGQLRHSVAGSRRRRLVAPSTGKN